jgi:hypothetical protein
MDAGRSAPGNGDAGTVEFNMNTLELIRNRLLKTQRLENAQNLMAKAYRGVAYVDAHHDAPAQNQAPKELYYRGHHYVR